jgi:hypothetical protein
MGELRTPRTHVKETANMEKLLPVLTTDAEAEAFVSETDLSEFDLSAMVPTRFDFATDGDTENFEPGRARVPILPGRTTPYPPHARPMA